MKAETGQLLQRVPAASPLQVQEILLTALTEAVTAWSGAPAVTVTLEGHGREAELVSTPPLDVSRTVGWFTALYPLRLTRGADRAATLRGVKDQWRGVPGRGVSYGWLRYLSPDAATRAALAATPWPEISFNYLGQFDQGEANAMLTLAPESSGPSTSPQTAREHLLEVTARVIDGQLRTTWSYGAQVHARA